VASDVRPRGAVLSTRRASALRREGTAALRIPYTAHVAEWVVKTALGDYLQAFRLGGASFESADDEQLNSWHERLNVLWRNLASPTLRYGLTWSVAPSARSSRSHRAWLRGYSDREVSRAPRRRNADGQ